jgi:hypothetical protein
MCDLAEFKSVNIITKGGKLSSKSLNFAPRGNKKVFTFTNKMFGHKVETGVPKNLNKYDWAALNNHVETNYLSKKQALRIWDEVKTRGKTVRNPDGSDATLKGFLENNRMGLAKVNVALNKMEPTNKKPSKVFRYISAREEDLPGLKKAHNPNITITETPYSRTKKGVIKYDSTLSTGIIDDTSLDGFKNGYSVGVKYTIKPKTKGSSGRYLGGYENEYLYPSNTRFKVSGMRKNRKKGEYGYVNYDVGLEEI